MADEAAQRAMDAEDHKKIYDGIMTACTHVGVPFTMGLTMFFVQLVMRSGVITAGVMFVITYLLVWFIVKTFFSSH
jgi:hypothetical protein